MFSAVNSLCVLGMCYSNEFKCVSEDVCIPTANVCDEVPDCTDASDERSASSGNPDCELIIITDAYMRHRAENVSHLQ